MTAAGLYWDEKYDLFLFVCLFICLFVCLFIYLFVCLFVRFHVAQMSLSSIVQVRMLALLYVCHGALV